MIPWGAVRSMPEYQAANPLLKRKIRDMWFQDYGDQVVEPEDFDRAKMEFVAGEAGSLTQGQGPGSGLMDKIEALGNDGLTPQDSAQSLIEGLDRGIIEPPAQAPPAVPENFPSEPIMTGQQGPTALDLQPSHQFVMNQPYEGPLQSRIGNDPSRLVRAIAKSGDIAYGGYEGLMSALGGMAAGGVGMVGGLGAIAAGQGASGARKVQEDVARAMMPMPRTPEGMKNVQALGKAMDVISTPGKWADKKLVELGDPTTGWIVEQLTTIETFRALGKIPEGIFSKIGKTAAWRNMTVPERTLVVQSLADAIKRNPGMSEGELLRKYDNPAWREEAMAKRRKPENPIGATPPTGAAPGPAAEAPPQAPQGQAPAPPPASSPGLPPGEAMTRPGLPAGQGFSLKEPPNFSMVMGLAHPPVPHRGAAPVAPSGIPGRGVRQNLPQPEQKQLTGSAIPLPYEPAVPLSGQTGPGSPAAPGPTSPQGLARAGGQRKAAGGSAQKSSMGSPSGKPRGRIRQPAPGAPGDIWLKRVRDRSRVVIRRPGQEPFTVRPGDTVTQLIGDERRQVRVRSVSGGNRPTINGKPAKYFYPGPRWKPKEAPKAAARVSGRTGNVYAGKDKTPMRYEVMEADDLVPSHDFDTFARREDYPEGVQERAYHRDKSEQLKVINHAKQLKTIYLLTNNPDSVNGPPIVLGNGVVLGGNSRAMTLQRAYHYGLNGKKYRRKLLKFADQFGINPDKIKGFKQPVLVRRLRNVNDVSTKNLHRLASMMNQTPTQAMDEAAQTASRGANVSHATLERIGDTITDRELTLRELLAKPDGLKILDRLIADGVLDETDRSKYINTRYGQLNQAGKDLVEKTVLGSIIPDADILDAAPKSYINKVARSLTPLSKLKARKGEPWDLTDDMQRALELALDAKGAGLTVGEYLKQGSLFEGAQRDYTARQATMANALDTLSSVKLAGRLKEFAAVARSDVKNQKSMFGRPDPEKEFARIFKDVAIEGRQTAGKTLPGNTAKEGAVKFQPRGSVAHINVGNRAKYINGPSSADGYLTKDGFVVIDGHKLSPRDKLYMTKDRDGDIKFTQTPPTIKELDDLAGTLNTIKKMVEVSEKIDRSVQKGGPDKNDGGFLSGPPAWEQARYRKVPSHQNLLAREIDSKFDTHDPEAIKNWITERDTERYFTLQPRGYLHLSPGTEPSPSVVAALKAWVDHGGALGRSGIEAIYPPQKAKKIISTISGGNGSDQAKEDLPGFKDFGKPRDMFGQVAPEKKVKGPPRKRKAKLENPVEAQLDLFSGKADKPMQPSLFGRKKVAPTEKKSAPAEKKPAEIKKASGPGEQMSLFEPVGVDYTTEVTVREPGKPDRRVQITQDAAIARGEAIRRQEAYKRLRDCLSA